MIITDKKLKEIKDNVIDTLYSDIYYHNFIRLWTKWDEKLKSGKLAKATGLKISYISQLKWQRKNLGIDTIKKLIPVFGCDRLDFIQIDDINHIMPTTIRPYFRELQMIKEILSSDQTHLKEALIGTLNGLYATFEQARDHKKKQDAS